MSSPLIEEALRYLGAADAPETLRRQVAGEAETLSAQFRPRHVCKVCELDFQGEEIFLCGTAVVLKGGTALKMLAQCHRAALLACTLGARFDLALTAVQARDMARAVILDACGSALVEQGCDEAEKELSARFPGRYLTDRFSSGYELILAALGSCAVGLFIGWCGVAGFLLPILFTSACGLAVTESLLLNPVKSVTAVIGLSDRPQMARIRGCAYCQMRERCTRRKGGKHCGN